MQLLKAQSYKLFIKRFFLPVIIVFFIYISLSTAYKLNEGIKLDKTAFAAYRECIIKYGGEITEEKKSEIEAMFAYYDKISKNTEKLNADFTEEKISITEYNESIGKLNSSLEKLPGIIRFRSIYESAVYSEKEIADELPWNIIFAENSIDIFLVLTVSFMVIMLSIYDEETGIKILEFSAVKGKKAAALTQILMISVLSFLTCFVMQLLKLIIAEVYAGTESFFCRAESFALFMNTEINLNIISVYILSSLIKSAGCVYLAFIVLCTGLYTHSSVNAVFTGLACTYLPEYITYDFSIKHYLPFPSSLLTGEAYFSTVKTSLGFMGDKNYLMYIFFIALTLIIFIAVVYFSFRVMAGRKVI